MFITPEELSTLTGYVLNGAQRRWLDKHAWAYEIAANGRVVVSRAYAESRLSGAQVKRPPTMNVEAIRKRA